MKSNEKKDEIMLSADNSTVKIDNEKLEQLTIIPKVAPENLKYNEVFIEGYGVLEIKPTLLKYFYSVSKKKGSMYSNVMLIKQMGFNNVLIYNDGNEVIESALKAIFDTDKIDFIDKLTTKNLSDIIRIANEVNEVKIDDFLENQKIVKEESENQKEKV